MLFKVISFVARGTIGPPAEGNVRSGHKNGKWKRLDKVQCARPHHAGCGGTADRGLRGVGVRFGRRVQGRRRRATEIARVKVFPVEVSQSV